MDDAPNSVTARPERDVASIRRIVEGEPVSLRDKIMRLVVEGVRDNWVVYDPLSGCPIANKPSGPVLVAISAFETWWQSRTPDDNVDNEIATAWRREYWTVVANFPTQRSLRITRQFGDWLHGIDSSTAGRENPSEWIAWLVAASAIQAYAPAKCERNDQKPCVCDKRTKSHMSCEANDGWSECKCSEAPLPTTPTSQEQIDGSLPLNDCR